MRPTSPPRATGAASSWTTRSTASWIAHRRPRGFGSSWWRAIREDRACSWRAWRLLWGAGSPGTRGQHPRRHPPRTRGRRSSSSPPRELLAAAQGATMRPRATSSCSTNASTPSRRRPGPLSLPPRLQDPDRGRAERRGHGGRLGAVARGGAGAARPRRHPRRQNVRSGSQDNRGRRVAAADPDVFSDRRQLRAPLPGMAVGAIIEEEVTWTASLLSGLGSSSILYFGELSRAREPPRVEAARARRCTSSNASARAAASRAAGKGDRVRLVYDAGPRRPATCRRGWPEDVPVRPSWLCDGSDLARGRGALRRAPRESAGGRGPVGVGEGCARGRRGGSRTADRRSWSPACTGRFATPASSSVTPQSCRDGLPRCSRAATATARTRRPCWSRCCARPACRPTWGCSGVGSDVDPKLPSFDGFDRAIVYVPPPAAPALWIDATNPYAAVGELPVSDVDRRILSRRRAPTGWSPRPSRGGPQPRDGDPPRSCSGSPATPRHRAHRSQGRRRARLPSGLVGQPTKSLEDELTGYVKDSTWRRRSPASTSVRPPT